MQSGLRPSANDPLVWYERIACTLRQEAINAFMEGRINTCNHLFSRAVALELDMVQLRQHRHLAA